MKGAIPLLVCLLAVGCASYSAKPVVVGDVKQYEYHAEQSGVTVVADPYDTDRKYKSVFNTKPSYQRGYLGVNIIVGNNSDKPLTLDAAGVWAVSATGEVVRPVPARQVGEQLLRSTTGRYFLGGVIAAGSSKGANDKIRMDFENKELKSATIYAGQVTHGFLFFPTQPVTAELVVGGLKLEGQDLEAIKVAFNVAPAATARGE